MFCTTLLYMAPFRQDLGCSVLEIPLRAGVTDETFAISPQFHRKRSPDSAEILVRSLSTGVGERRVGPSRHLENTLVRRTLLHNRLIYRDALREIVRISRFVLCTGWAQHVIEHSCKVMSHSVICNRICVPINLVKSYFQLLMLLLYAHNCSKN